MKCHVWVENILFLFNSVLFKKSARLLMMTILKKKYNVFFVCQILKKGWIFCANILLL